MKSATLLPLTLLSLSIFAVITNPSHGMISVGPLTKKAAKERDGITMHARKNGDAGIKVWIQFKKQGWLEKFGYAELRMDDGRGKHLVSAMLQTNPVHHRQAKDITTAAFSASPAQLEKCSFLVAAMAVTKGMSVTT